MKIRLLALGLLVLSTTAACGKLPGHPPKSAEGIYELASASWSQAPRQAPSVPEAQNEEEYFSESELCPEGDEIADCLEPLYLQ
jgi:hypothetical protein